MCYATNFAARTKGGTKNGANTIPNVEKDYFSATTINYTTNTYLIRRTKGGKHTATVYQPTACSTTTMTCITTASNVQRTTAYTVHFPKKQTQSWATKINPTITIH
eukprot:9536717-Ditylum_brightwellii.AAC.1